jgi:hypothetical protein
MEDQIRKSNMDPSVAKHLIDKASSFFGRIVNPGADEFGLLIADKIRSKRFMNQVDILLKVKKYVEERGLTIQAIPIKILVPLLEHGSLEEDESLQELWAKMLTNMLDSEENFQNHIFPSILSQLSIEDYEQLLDIDAKESDLERLEQTVNEFIRSESTTFTRDDGRTWESHIHRSKEYENSKQKLDELKAAGFSAYSPEADNLVRLGLIRQLPPKIYIPEFRLTGVDEVPVYEQYQSITAEYEEDIGYRLTTLGSMFVAVCKLD